VKESEESKTVKMFSCAFAGIIYFHYVNSGEKYFKEEFNMTKHKNVVVYPPRTDTEVNVIDVPPRNLFFFIRNVLDSTESLIFRVAKDGGFGYSYTKK